MRWKVLQGRSFGADALSMTYTPWRTENANGQKGADLERAIAAYFAAQGYSVRCNLHENGRSGVAHELDVVAERQDIVGLVRFVIECKAWSGPIDKEVVFKLRGELEDLGGARGIIVALNGATAQARGIARQGGIDIWDAGELAQRLGRPQVSYLNAGPPKHPDEGWGFSIEGRAAQLTASGAIRGVVGRERIVRFAPLWVPVLVCQLSITRIEGRLRPVSRTTGTWATYEALSGRWAGNSDHPPDLVPVDVSAGHIRPMIRPADIDRPLQEAVRRWQSVKTDAARARHAQTLATFGVIAPLQFASVERGRPAFLPTWVAFLQRPGGGERVVVVDGQTGRVRKGLGEVLTTKLDIALAAVSHGPTR